MSDEAGSLVVLRPGELFLKGKNRIKFERRLAQNVAATLRPLGQFRLSGGRGRLYVEGPLGPEAIARLAATFGVSSVSRAIGCTRDPASVEAVAVEAARRAVASGARSFAVDARRPDKSFPMRSMDLNRIVGAAIAVATGMRVDLDKPDVTIGIEAGDRCFVYADRVAGPGGLPVGTSGNALLLLSGGIDSPVAGWLAQKRGLRLEAAFFHSFPWVGLLAREKVVDLAARLARTQCGLRLWVVPFAPIQEALRDGAPSKLLVLLYRRMMVRIAERIARREGLEALVTGDSLGQVASQTLPNLACVESACGLPLLRPLLAFDKQDTIAVARRIGTYDKSSEPQEDCCSLFVPDHPETRGSPVALAALEERLPVEEWTAKAAEGSELVCLDVQGMSVSRRDRT